MKNEKNTTLKRRIINYVLGAIFLYFSFSLIKQEYDNYTPGFLNASQLSHIIKRVLAAGGWLILAYSCTFHDGIGQIKEVWQIFRRAKRMKKLKKQREKEQKETDI